ncbi:MULTISPECIES: AAA family ATPase [unclassified Neptuniibacter]|uniref:AAA family ATPase n=1 Tax=unclassified Neptuniibacter TaxID=2630693 RepID=UPI0025D3A539|nr:MULTISPECIES: AAA family ATPase [unclassified Neptuniibacter]|tara:strand:+ start:13179 stop:15500 length:2322 start_codon:yes stop_codon:yes gene_type:complete
MNWKISRIEIASFKAFRKLTLNVSESSLLTLDGPNGFGKTSIFDALELLFTGKISRIKRLFSNVMTGGKSNYEDNLYWNIRSTASDLYIKVELSDGPNDLILARHARATSRQPATNRADKFEPFLLYQLESFDSDDFSKDNLRDESFIAEIFGDNFRGNYSLLNYLEQGQNEYLFSTRLDRRKDALEELTNTTQINKEISKCKDAERKLNQKLKENEKASLELVEERKSLNALLVEDLEEVEYAQICTSEIQPEWDKEQLFVNYSKEAHDKYLECVYKISELIGLKHVIKVRIDNDKIESYISRNNEIIKLLAQLGKTTTRLNDLDASKKVIDSLTSAYTTLQKGPNLISFEEIEKLIVWVPEEFKKLKSQIAQRDNLIKATTASTTISTEIARLKDELVNNHFKLVADDKDCPLCGADWESHSSLLTAIAERAKAIESTLSIDGQKLIEVVKLISGALDVLSAKVTTRLTTINTTYDENLHQLLLTHKEKISLVQNLIKRLETGSYTCPDTYTLDSGEVANRFSDLVKVIRTRKKEEVAALPEHWRSTLYGAFKSEDDFYLLDSSVLDKKIKYISMCANKSQNTEIHKISLKLAQIIREGKAVVSARDKMKQLKELLIKVEKTYSDQTISEIELIFHIYSGRLIQNYQRGLGLFIESRDGKHLRFSTAERSEHDAILAMSSGQISALSLAFFFSLNRVYSRVPIVLIDDPSQSLDEVNIASLTDLLRCELNDRQLIVSSHEEDISSYMRYRFSRAGLKNLTLNMQSLAKDAS